jgi:hypothetical protein
VIINTRWNVVAKEGLVILILSKNSQLRLQVYV